MNYRLGLTWAFCIAAICWYLAGGFVLYPKWDQANRARQEANRILTGEREKDGTMVAFADEVHEVTPTSIDDLVKNWKPHNPDAQSDKSDTGNGFRTGLSAHDPLPVIKKKLSPMRFEAWRNADSNTNDLRPVTETAVFLFVPVGIYGLFIAGWRARLGSESKFGVRYRREITMKLADSIRGFNIRQRAVVWLGGVVLLVVMLYPKMQTTYYGWGVWRSSGSTTSSWLILYQTDRRMYIADAAFDGMPEDVKKGSEASYPEVRHTLHDLIFEGMCVDRRESIKVLNLILEMLVIVLVTAGLAWVLKSSPPSQAAEENPNGT